MFKNNNRLRIPCADIKYVVVELHYSVGFIFGSVATSCCSNSPVIKSTSWSLDGRCLTDKKYDLNIEEIFTSDYHALAACLDVS